MKKLLLGLLLLGGVSHAELFQQGNVGMGIIVGNGSSLTREGTQNYTIVGVSADYFIVDDLSVGLGYMGWFGGTPTLNQVTLPITYYIPLDEKFRPYLGAFMRETYISEGYDDYESYGAKAGVAISFSKKSYLGIGVVQEFYGSGKYGDESSSTYPEIIFAFSF
ncbi:MAG: hypothetical protein AUK54_05010 [Helicobacteraceae bacterium CG2_30_36_10]|nr:MAG: hypothetical protein AUK54_05010 [Helicobacteraceae bacterium CG2_30_36_10]